MPRRGDPTTTQTLHTALVTGAAGFVGSHLVDVLLLNKVRVTGFDNLTTGSRQNLDNAEMDEAFTLIEGDIRDSHAIGEACNNCDIVFHLAAVTKVAESVRNPQKYTDINVTGTQNVINGAIQAQVKRVVFASSAAVYGTPETVPISEDATTQPLSPYGSSKLKGEQLCQKAAAQGIIAPQLRLFNIFGPRQTAENEAGVVSIFIQRAQQGVPLIIFGDGHQTRDFIYIDDVVNAFLRAATLETIPSNPINVGTGIPVSIRELAEAIQQIIPSCSKEMQFEPPRAGDIYHSVAKIDQMQNLLQLTPQFSLYDGLRRYCRTDSERYE